MYDNSIIGDPPFKQNISACVFETTEHFVLEKADTSARMHLTTTDIFQTILNKLHFLSQIQPKSIIEDNGNWFTTDTFANVFRFTQLLTSDNTQDVNMCTPFLYLRSENSSVCKLGSTIRFSDEACSSLINQLVTIHDWANDSFVVTLSRLPLHKVYTFVDNGNQDVDFPNINSETKLCKVEIDADFRSTLQNIYMSSALMFKNYENLLETFFPEPLCQILSFNIPDSIHINIYMQNFQEFWQNS